MPDRILCPIDFSDASSAALRYAEDLASKSGSELIIAHAFSRPATWDSQGQTEPSDRSLRDRFHAVSCNVPFRHVMHAGPPGPVICWLAQENDCDLIIMGTHGRTGLKHLLLGSTAEYVLQHARCPVLSVRQRASDEPRLSEPIVMPIPGPGA